MAQEKQQQCNKISDDEFKRIALLLNQKTKRMKLLQDKYQKIKKDCSEILQQYFNENNVNKAASFQTLDKESFVGKCYKVNRVQKSEVIFDEDALEFVLDKETASACITKHYEITDMQGLTMYLKECGVDPAIFRKFLNVQKSVNRQELERLEAVGVIDKEDLVGCYTVKLAQPYFTVSEKEIGESECN